MAISMADGRNGLQARPRRRGNGGPNERPAAAPIAEHDYWLAHCEGFRVDGVGGRIGFVDEVRPDGILAVRAGLLGRRLLLFAAEAAGHVVPQAEQIWLRSDATIVGSETDSILGTSRRA